MSWLSRGWRAAAGYLGDFLRFLARSPEERDDHNKPLTLGLDQIPTSRSTSSDSDSAGQAGQAGGASDPIRAFPPAPPSDAAGEEPEEPQHAGPVDQDPDAPLGKTSPIHRFQAQLRQVTLRVFVTPALVVMNVLVFIIMAISSVGLVHPDVAALVSWDADFGPATTGGQPWRMLTSNFIHIGVIHLLLNMWALFSAGEMIERICGNGFFLAIYIFSGLTGSLGSLLWNPRTVSAGASGGIFGALAAFLLAQRRSMDMAVLAKLRASTLPFIGYNLFYGFSQAGIDNAGHIGGLVGGFLLGLVLAWPLDASREIGGAARLLAGGAAGCGMVLLLWTILAKDEGRFRQDLAWLAGEQARLGAAERAWATQAESGELDETELSRRLESCCLGGWEQVVDRLGRAPASIRQRYSRIFEFAEARRDSLRALVEGLRESDQAKLDRYKELYDRAAAILTRKDDSGE